MPVATEPRALKLSPDLGDEPLHGTMASRDLTTLLLGGLWVGCSDREAATAVGAAQPPQTIATNDVERLAPGLHGATTRLTKSARDGIRYRLPALADGWQPMASPTEPCGPGQSWIAGFVNPPEPTDGATHETWLVERSTIDLLHIVFDGTLEDFLEQQLPQVITAETLYRAKPFHGALDGTMVEFRGPVRSITASEVVHEWGACALLPSRGGLHVIRCRAPQPLMRLRLQDFLRFARSVDPQR
jgi:hypothetical protein